VIKQDQCGEENSGAGQIYCGCGTSVDSKPWFAGWIDTSAGRVPRVSTEFGWQDFLGAVRVRLNIGRMEYSIPPGLYAVGNPDTSSPVLVSANYKLSFDSLRRELTSIDAWILVLDTKGVNVWCAAGKGTFGTGEVINRVRVSGVEKIVIHRNLILPQLSAPGVAAHVVKKECGFSVVYGPVRASDIKTFLKNGMHATPELRRVEFNLIDRMVAVPVELVQWFSWLLLLSLLMLGLSGVEKGGYSCSPVFVRGGCAVAMIVAAYLAGGIVTPCLLPWLPGRAFSLKGFWVGLALWAMFLTRDTLLVPGGNTRMAALAFLLIICAITSFMAMNYTGTSTFTSQSGVKKEMRFAVPLQIAALVAGVCLWVMSGIFFTQGL